MVTTRIFRSLDEIGLEPWNDLGPPVLHLSGQWLRCVEGSLTPHSAYVLAEQEDRGPLGGLAAYLVTEEAWPFLNPAHLVLGEALRQRELDRFMDGASRARSDRLRTELASVPMESYPSAVCVAPFGFTAAVCARQASAEVFERLLDGFERVAEEWGARSRAFLYVPDDASEVLTRALRRRGYLGTLLGARAVLPIPWSSFDGYLQSLGGRRHRTVRREIAKSGLRITAGDVSSLAGTADRLAYLAARLLEKYGAPLLVAEVREALRRIEANLGPFIRTFMAWKGDEIVAFSLLHEWQGALYMHLAGQDYDQLEKHDFAHPHTVYYEPIRLAIARRAKSIDFGTEAYRTKVLRGCELRHLHGYFDLGPGASRRPLAELLALQEEAERRRLDSYARLRPRGAPSGAGG